MSDPDTPASAPRPATGPRWQVHLLGRVQASEGERQIRRFPSRAAAALLARLVLQPQRAHPREELVELLWPGVALDVGRNRLRQTLSSLKAQLQSPGWPELVLADRYTVQVAADAFACDVVEFERLRRRADQAQAARALYVGEFMPGFYDDWIAEERLRLAALADRLPAPPLPSDGPPAAAALRGASGLKLAAAPLPAYATRLFGIEDAVQALRQQVLGQRLVTLHGSGGSGKTRLAVEVAQSLAGGAAPFFGRASFVALQTCTDTDGLRAALAAALQLPSSAAQGEGLLAALASLPTLLVLDNFEQLVGRAEGFVAQALAAVPTLHVLVTSRCVLGLDGERCVEAPTLPLPAPGSTLGQAFDNAAVALFVDRAQAARGDFHLTERHLEGVLAVVRALEGLPLAIELAASRVRSFAPAEMAAWLATAADGVQPRQLALLARSGPRSGIDARHATMTQVVAFSWQMLDATQVQALIAAARLPADGPLAAIGAAAQLGSLQTADAVDALVRHALVRAVEQPSGARRFHVLEPVREYALSQAADAAARDARCRARAWLLQWAQDIGPYPRPAVVAEQAPLVHALLVQAVADGDALGAAELALALRAHWDTDGMPWPTLHALTAAAQALSNLLGDEAAPAAAVDARTELATAGRAVLLADLHELLAYAHFEAGDAAAAARHAGLAAQWAARSGQGAAQARASVRQAWLQLASHQGPQGLEPLLRHALAQAQEAQDLGTQARALHQWAVLHSNHLHDPAGAEALLAQSQVLHQSLGDTRKAMARQRARANCWIDLGRSEEALAVLEQAEASAREEGDHVGELDAAWVLGALHARARRWAPAVVAAQRCLGVAWRRQHAHGLLYALWQLPRPLMHLGQTAAALRLAAFAAADWQRRFGPLSASDARLLRALQRVGARRLSAEQAQALWRQGAEMKTAQAVALALDSKVDSSVE